MNPALVAKVRAKIGTHNKDTAGLLRFARNDGQNAEKKFVAAYLSAAETGIKDVQYYLNLWHGAKQLKKPHNTAMQHALGTEIDLQNILWLYRLKKFYGIFGDAAYGHLVPICHRLPLDVFTHLAAIKNANGMQAILSNTVYRGVFGDFSNAQRRLTHAVKARYRAEGRRSHIALLCGYFYEVLQ